MKVTEKYIGEAPLKKSPKKKLSLVIKDKAIDMSKLSDEVITYINESGGAWEGSGNRVKFNATDNYQEAKQASATNHGTIYFSQGTKPEEYHIFLNGEDYTGLVTLTAGENPGTLIINGDTDHPITIVETSHFTNVDVNNGWLRKFIDGNPIEVAKLVTSYNELTDKLTKSDVETLLQAPNGVAILDNTGKIPSSQLPSYVDDVVDIMGCYNYYDELYRPLVDGKLKLNPTASDFTPDTKIPPTAEPGTYYMALYHTLGGSNPGIYHYVSGMTWTREYGEAGKIYVESSTNKQYRFAEDDYTPHEIIASPGTTDDVTEGSVNKYFTENRARAAVSEAMLQRELLVNKTTTIREAGEADNTKYPTELATRTLVDQLLGLISALDDRVTALEEGSGSDSDSSSSGVLVPQWYVGQISRTKTQFSELTVEQLVSSAQPIDTDQKTANFTINESCWFCMIPEGEDIQSAQYTVSGITSTFTEQEIKNGFVTDVTHDDIEIDGITYKIYVNRNTALVDSNAAASFTLKTR